MNNNEKLALVDAGEERMWGYLRDDKFVDECDDLRHILANIERCQRIRAYLQRVPFVVKT